MQNTYFNDLPVEWSRHHKNFAENPAIKLLTEFTWNSVINYFAWQLSLISHEHQIGVLYHSWLQCFSLLGKMTHKTKIPLFSSSSNFFLPTVPLSSFQKPQIPAVYTCKLLKDVRSPETKIECLTHLLSPISYLIVNLRTADLIYLFVISILNKLLLWLPCTWYSMHTSIFVNFLPHLGKNININGPKSLNTEMLLSCIIFWNLVATPLGTSSKKKLYITDAFLKPWNMFLQVYRLQRLLKIMGKQCSIPKQQKTLSVKK